MASKHVARESSLIGAAKTAFAQTARGNVYAQLGAVAFDRDIEAMRQNGAKLDLKREIAALKVELKKK
jgi:hypothetical protein